LSACRELVGLHRAGAVRRRQCREGAAWCRDDYFSCDPPTELGVAEVIIAASRRGRSGTVRVRWDADAQRFEDLEEGEGF
jgi:hypothetical protein